MRHPLTSLLALGLLAAGLAACSPSSSQLPGGLQLEEHALADAPTPEPFGFQPLQGTQDEILARHADDRAATFPIEVDLIDGNPAIVSLGDSGDLVARLIPSPEDPVRSIAVLYRGEEEIFSADAGLPSPALPLQALWSYDGHWALEVLYADTETWAGHVYIDGELVNALKGYDEAFGFQLLDGKPFYFYVREGSVGISYAGEEADIGYDEVIHYRCCAESTLNPVQAVNMVALFAQRDGTWSYVELGRFGS